MIGFIIPLLIFVLPAASVIWFVGSLIGFCRTPKGSPERRSKRVALILSSTACAVILTAITLLMMIFVNALANM